MKGSDPDAKRIAAQVFISRHTEKNNVRLPPNVPEEAKEFLAAIKENPLTDSDVKLILEAVKNYNIGFLKNLVRELEFCHLGQPLRDQLGLEIQYWHQSFIGAHGISPTNAQLLGLVQTSCPEVILDPRVLRRRCEELGLPLHLDRLGRPKKSDNPKRSKS